MILNVVLFLAGVIVGLLVAYVLYPRLKTPPRDEKGRFVSVHHEEVKRPSVPEVVTRIKPEPPIKDWSAIKRDNWSKLEEERKRTDGIL